jgi:hypothetical protein
MQEMSQLDICYVNTRNNSQPDRQEEHLTIQTHHATLQEESSDCPYSALNVFTV